ncbi:PREDICTED: carbonyl reductase [NADPH] 1-like isoform X2 [Priapulus caudatus]|nr:PREDICTED: carbonyl reductase [NADPH] 1-like isoform X2 [Priapulus caudatus]
MYIGKEKEEVAAIVQATTTLQVNLFGHLEVYKHLFPIFRPHARIVNIASTLGLLNYNNNEEVREKLMSGELTMQDIVNLAEEYLRDVEQGLEEQKDWPDAYSVSKTLVMAATRVQARELAEDSHEDVIVNSCCPGWVKTNLTGNRGVKSPALGADTPVYLALLPPNCASPVGEFVVDRKIRRVR